VCRCHLRRFRRRARSIERDPSLAVVGKSVPSGFAARLAAPMTAHHARSDPDQRADQRNHERIQPKRPGEAPEQEVGSHLARDGDPWWYCLPFVLLTLFFEAVPALMVLVLGKRADVVLPKVRNWMTVNSWIISEVVIVLFIAIEINSLAGS
jgi:hypothetical protein